MVNLARIDRRDLPEFLRDMELYRGDQLTKLPMKLIALTFTRIREVIGAE